MPSQKTEHLNLRVESEFAQAIDAKRIALSRELRYIPSRSEIIRFALESYLDLKGGGNAQGAPSPSGLEGEVGAGAPAAPVKRRRGQT